MYWLSTFVSEYPLTSSNFNVEVTTVKPDYGQLVAGPFATRDEAVSTNHERLQRIADANNGKVWNGTDWIPWPGEPGVVCVGCGIILIATYAETHTRCPFCRAALATV